MAKRRGEKGRKPYRWWLMMVLLLAAAATGFFYWSNHAIRTDFFTYTDERLPDGFDGLTVAHLSDLHGAVFGEGNGGLLAAVAAAEPDLIALTGDLLDQAGGEPADYVEQIAAGLTAIAPTYYVTGNHEWAREDVGAVKKKLTAAGVTVLSNRFVPVERNGDVLLLAGIDDPNGYADQKTPEELAQEVYAAGEDPYWILLAHRNTFFAQQYSRLGADLTLSGHGHGGLIRLPFTDGLISTDRTLFPTYTSGFYTAGGKTVFVSRGLGNSGWSFRLFNRPQVAVLTLRQGGAEESNN